MNDNKILDFLATMSAYDGFSDINHPKVRLWDLELNEKTENDFSYYCVLNIKDNAPLCHIETVNDYYEFIKTLKLHYSDLSSTDYPEYTKGDFEFQSRLVGFAICFIFNNKYSVIPIIELSGLDAESIVTAMMLVS